MSRKLIMILSSTVIFLLCLHVSYCTPTPLEQELEPLSDAMADYINDKAKASWYAGRNERFKTVEDFTRLLGVIDMPAQPKLPRYRPLSPNDEDDLPESFDSRKHWPNCTSIGTIRDQSNCGSCWAIAAVEAMSDRICIYSGGKSQVSLSTRDLMSCCSDCGDGCHGGYPSEAWAYWKNVGIVTGGDIDEPKRGCQPYPLKHCHRHTNHTEPSCKGSAPTPECLHTCRAGYPLQYNDDLHFGKDVYSVEGEKDIMREIMQSGPLEAAFDVYRDFLHYKHGVYHHVVGKHLGGHAVKMVGWGVDEVSKLPYWLIANSWDTNWGEEGYFKISRGQNECNIEKYVVGGKPKL